MTKPFQGRVAIITGAAQGIGKATAVALAAQGAKVVLVDKNDRGAEDVRAEIGALGAEGLVVKADVARPADIEQFVAAAVARFARLDVLINNASDIVEMLSRDLDVVATDVETWDRSYEVNLRGPAIACKAAIPHMIKEGGGAIVNIASVDAMAGDIVRCAYGSMKAGLVMLSKYIATQYGSRGIRCNSVSPGLVMSPSAETADSGFLGILRSNILLGRAGAPADLASVIAFLASDAAAYVTGQNIVVDGGLMCHVPQYAQIKSA